MAFSDFSFVFSQYFGFQAKKQSENEKEWNNRSANVHQVQVIVHMLPTRSSGVLIMCAVPFHFYSYIFFTCFFML